MEVVGAFVLAGCLTVIVYHKKKTHEEKFSDDYEMDFKKKAQLGLYQLF